MLINKLFNCLSDTYLLKRAVYFKQKGSLKRGNLLNNSGINMSTKYMEIKLQLIWKFCARSISYYSMRPQIVIFAWLDHFNFIVLFYNLFIDMNINDEIFHFYSVVVKIFHLYKFRSHVNGMNRIHFVYGFSNSVLEKVY